MGRRTAIVTCALILVLAGREASAQQLCQSMGSGTASMCFGEQDPLNGGPLAGRMPVVLIHGLNPAGGPSDPAQWNNLVAYLGRVPWMRQYFKLYQVTYDSNLRSVTDLSRMLAGLIDAYDGTDAGFAASRPVIIAHSMGTLVARSLMEEQRLRNGQLGGERIAKLIALGGPFHGTPAANGPARDTKAGISMWMFDFFESFFTLSWSAHNRIDLAHDNYDVFFQNYDPQEDNVWLRRLNAAARYSSKVSAYGGIVAPTEIPARCLTADLLGCLGVPALIDGLGIVQNDGIVPYASASLDGCVGCTQLPFFGYNHYQMQTGQSPDDSNLFGAILGDLADLVASNDTKRFSFDVLLANPATAVYHNLRGWGPTASISDPLIDNPGKNQMIGGTSSLDLYVDPPRLINGVPESYNLRFVFGNGPCDDTFDVYANGQLVWPGFDDGSDAFIALVKGEYIKKRRVTVSFVNRSSDGCGFAPIVTVTLNPTNRS
jgi:pimeloyl-ACP methyl ester carboxylesterase